MSDTRYSALPSVTPLELHAYLRGRQWTLQERRENYSLWATTDERGEFEVLAPSSERLQDYRLRISAALNVLESAEQRPRQAILKDMNQAAADVVRFRLAADETHGGEVPIDYGLRLLQGARDAILAAACSVVEPRPAYHTRKPAAATDYLSRLQLGQTEIGSYVIALMSRVPPALSAADAGQLFAVPEEPFNRRVTLGFRSALEAAKRVSDELQVSGDLAALQDAVDLGVSANLCTALSSIGTDLDLDGLDVSFSWASARPLKEHGTTTVRFTPDNLTILNEAARWLKDTDNVVDYWLYGNVVRLESNDAAEGTVAVVGSVNGRVRKVHLALPSPWYGLAIKAHAEHLLVEAVGDVVKDGRRWKMTSISSFSIPQLDEE